MSHFRHMPVMSAKLLAQPVWRTVTAQSAGVHLVVLLLSRAGTHLSMSLLLPLWVKICTKI